MTEDACMPPRQLACLFIPCGMFAIRSLAQRACDEHNALEHRRHLEQLSR
jgi:hypothetical protein